MNQAELDQIKQRRERQQTLRAKIRRDGYLPSDEFEELDTLEQNQYAADVAALVEEIERLRQERCYDPAHPGVTHVRIKAGPEDWNAMKEGKFRW